MVESLRRLLGECIDFSGLTGPDELPVAEALARYLRYRAQAENWILSRFVCPAKKLRELAQNLEATTVETPFPVTVLGQHTSNVAEWEAELAASATAMNDFDGATGDLIEVAAFEIRPPPSLRAEHVLRDLNGFSEVDVFVETALGGDHEALFTAIADSEWAFLKADLSRPTKPDSFAVAKLVHEALALELPFKVVLGKGRTITNSSEYGLINLFGAVAVGLAEDLSTRELEAILNDGEWTHWRFDRQSISFHGWEADEDTIDQARDFLLEAQCGSVECAIDDLSSLGFAVREGA
jgi:hypothetical protein